MGISELQDLRIWEFQYYRMRMCEEFGHDNNAGQAGYPLTEDMNGFQQEGVGRMDATIHNGQR